MPGVNYARRFFALLALLRRETDAEHALDAAEIARRLREQEGLSVDPRSVRRTVAEMKAAGLPVDDAHRICWLGHFSPGETEYLMQAVAFGYGLTEADRQKLIGKILSLADRRPEPPASLPARPGNPRTLHTLTVLRRAMAQGRQVAFHYGARDADGALSPRLRRGDSGLPKVYNAHPYALVMNSGRPYLVAAVNRHAGLSHYRVDRILDVRLRKAPIRPLARPLDPALYPLRHPYMYAGPVRRYRLRVDRGHLNDVLDWFGTGVTLENPTRETVEAEVLCDAASMGIWLRRYGVHARVMEAGEEK